MKAKFYMAYYEDPMQAKRVMHALFDVGVQRDAMMLIEGDIPDEVLIEPAITLPEEPREAFQAELDRGGALIVAWVMHFWKKRANSVFDRYPPQKFDQIKGTRFEGLFTRT
jgi:hypothetical protein